MLGTLLSNAGGSVSRSCYDPACLAAEKNQNIKQRQSCNKFNKDFKNGPCQKKSLKRKLLLTPE